MKKYDGTPSKKKFKGYNFYIQCNDKLSKKNREKLLETSSTYLDEVFSSLPFSTDKKISDGLINELDYSLSDHELLDQWNYMYNSFGYLMSKFRNQWERERLKDFKFQTFRNSESMEDLIERVSRLEIEIKSIKFKSNRFVNM